MQLFHEGEYLAYISHERLYVIDASNGRRLYSYCLPSEDSKERDHYVIDDGPFLLTQYGLLGYPFHVHGNAATGRVKLVIAPFYGQNENTGMFRMLSKNVPKQEADGLASNEVSEERLTFGGRVRLVMERSWHSGRNNIRLIDMASGKKYDYVLDNFIPDFNIIRDRYLAVTKGSIQGSGGFAQSESQVLLFDLGNLGSEPRVLQSYSGETFDKLSSSAGDQQRLAVSRSDGAVFVYNTQKWDMEPVMLQADLEVVHDKNAEAILLFAAGGRFLNLGYSDVIFRWDLEVSGQAPQTYRLGSDITGLYNGNEMGDMLVETLDVDSTPWTYEQDSEERTSEERTSEERTSSVMLLELGHKFFADENRQAWLLEKACSVPFGRNMTRLEWATFFGEIPYRRTCDNWYEPVTGENGLN